MSIHDACVRQDLGGLQQLIGENPTLVNSLNESKETPLMLCKGAAMCAETLIAAGADVNAAGGMDAGDESGATPSELGQTTLHRACDHPGDAQLVHLLLSNGADPNIADASGECALHKIGFDSDIAQLLLDHGADPNAMDLSKVSPLHMACYYGKDSVVTALVRGGADIDSLDDIADTPMHWACWYLQMDAIKVLLAHDAKPALRNVDEETAIKKGVRACESRQNGKRLEQQLKGMFAAVARPQQQQWASTRPSSAGSRQVVQPSAGLGGGAARGGKAQQQRPSSARLPASQATQTTAQNQAQVMSEKDSRNSTFGTASRKMGVQQQARPQSAQPQTMASRQLSAASMASTAAIQPSFSYQANSTAPHSFDLSRGVPYFEIEHCVNCHRHQWCTRHNEGRYHQYHAEFEAAIRSAFGDGIEVKKNEPPPGFVIVPDSDALTELCVNAKGETIVFPALGAFEVFMCGVQIYSKIASGRWPNADKLAERAAEKWKLIAGEDAPTFQMHHYDSVNKDNQEMVQQMGEYQGSAPQ